ncbi:MAG: Uma2 family endonuclease [Bacteroidota bacterium]
MIAVAKRLINREEYYKMAEVGILKPEDRVELINGEIIEMSPIGSKHAASIHRLIRVLRKNLADEFEIRTQSPIFIDGHSEPEPDITIVEFREDDYAMSHPSIQEVKLIVEVSDSSLDYDQTTKAELYAHAGIAEYWVFDINQRVILIHCSPSPSGYDKINRLDKSDAVDFFGSSINIEELFVL